MGLESYKDICKDSNKHSSRGYSDDELLDSLREFKEDNGYINSQDYNENDRYPSHTTIRNRFGTWNNALRKAGLKVTRKSDLKEWQVYLDILKGAERYGEDYEQSALKNDDELIGVGTIKSKTGLTFNQIKRKLSLNPNRKQHLDVSDIVSELKKLKSEDRELSQDNVNEFCSFSDRAVIKFGDGSFVDGLEELGFEPTKRQIIKRKTSNSSSNASKSRRWLKNCRTYEGNADGYVYTMRLKTKESGAYYYVGKVNKNNSLQHRLSQHIGDSGNFEKYGIDVIDISLEDVKSVYEKDGEFNQRLSKLEHNEFCDVILENSTKKVLGGK